MQVLAWLCLISGFTLAAIGTIFPAVPGIAMAFLGLLIFKWILPEAIAWWVVIAVFGLTLISAGVDFVASLFGAKLGGASKMGIFGAAVGGIVGVFFFPIGLLLGPFFGAVVGDLLSQRKSLAGLLRSGIGATMGFVFSLVFRMIALILSFILVGINLASHPQF